MLDIGLGYLKCPSSVTRLFSPNLLREKATVEWQ